MQQHLIEPDSFICFGVTLVEDALTFTMKYTDTVYGVCTRAYVVYRNIMTVLVCVIRTSLIHTLHITALVHAMQSYLNKHCSSSLYIADRTLLCSSGIYIAVVAFTLQFWP